jgi:hypothetical protein
LDSSRNIHQQVDGASTSSYNTDHQHLESQVLEELSNDGTQTTRIPAGSSAFGFPGNIGMAPSYSEEAWQHVNEQKSANPFDLPYDSEFDSNDMFLDMSSLQGALPDIQTPQAFLNGVSQPWLAADSVPSYLPAPAVAQGGLAYMAGQASTNSAAQGPVAFTGGNPFA